MENRTLSLLGEDSFNKLKTAKVLIVGIGGVGGYVAEILARSFVGKIIIVDGDVVELSNCNRQLVALRSTLGQFKVDVLEKRMKDINPECEVKKYNIRFNKSTQDEIFKEDFDYIVDAIDSVNDKVALILKAKRESKYIISAMGAGNRIDLNKFVIEDIYKTSNDRLARKLRGLLRKESVENLDVCYSRDIPDVVSSRTLSIAHNPACMGITIAAHVINLIIKS